MAGKATSTSQTAASVSSTFGAGIQQKNVTSSVPLAPSCRSTVKVRPSSSTVLTTNSATRLAAPPRMLAHADKNAPTIKSTTILQQTTITRTSTKIASSATTFAAKLSESHHHHQTMGVPSSTGKPRNLSVNQSTVNSVSPQPISTIREISHISPKHSRPTPTASAPPNMQHMPAAPAPGKLPFPAAPILSASTSDCASSGRSSTPVGVSRDEIASLITAITGFQTTVPPPANLSPPQQYSLFNSMSQQPMWRRDSESVVVKPNFAVVTGCVSTTASNTAIAPQQFEQDAPPPVDASKAPGYRIATVSSPVSSKTSSSSTTPPNLSLSTAYQGFNDTKLQQPQHQEQQPPPSLAPIGSNARTSQTDLYHFSAAELSPRDVHHIPTRSDSNLYKTSVVGSCGVSAFNDTATLNPVVTHALVPPYHTSASLQHINFSQSPTQGILPSASGGVSRLNPKAPDFSCHSTQKAAPVYGGVYPGSSDAMFSPGKASSVSTGMGLRGDSFHRSAPVGVTPHQNRWSLMNSSTSSSSSYPSQNELMSGMVGMTIHGLARDISENGELGLGGSGGGGASPAMSPVLQAHLHNFVDGYAAEERKSQQPIGTERARKLFPSNDMNWLLNQQQEQKVLFEGVRSTGSSWTQSADANPMDKYVPKSMMRYEFNLPMMENYRVRNSIFLN